MAVTSHTSQLETPLPGKREQARGAGGKVWAGAGDFGPKVHFSPDKELELGGTCLGGEGCLFQLAR